MGPEQDSPAVSSLKGDTRSSSEIEGNIRRTRDRLDDTLENLNERLSPRALINDVLNWLESSGVRQAGNGSADSLGRGYRSVVRQVKEHPMPAVLIGAGIAWWIFKPENNDLPRSSYRTADAKDEWVPQSPEPSETGFVSHESPQGSGIGSMVKKKSGQTQEALSDATDAVKEKVSNIGSGVQADRVIEQVKDTGRETFDKVKAVAERVGEATIEEAKKQGITREAAGDKISEMAGKIGAVGSQAKEEAIRAAEEKHLKPSSNKEQSKPMVE
jgi:hypothetical protein